MGDSSTYDKSQRSVFVGNIPYEATEEKLKEIFSEIGPVLSFKLVYDRENGKPKGYGFCEYQDPEMALSAMRNLNGYEIGGRTLRVDNACTEKNRMMEMNQGNSGSGMGAGGAQEGQGPYGAEVPAQQAPEAISKAVASLPPEQMFELMKQMKTCIQNNPTEAAEMLRSNPQLAYALLQAQVVMRIVDPEIALTMLHKTRPNPPMFHSAMNVGGDAGPSSVAGPPPGIPSGGPIGFGMLPPNMGGAPPPNAQYPGFNPASTNEPPRRDPREDRYLPSSGGRRDPRSRDPRGSGGPGDFPNARPGGAPPVVPAGGPRGGIPAGLPAHLAGADPEKTQLIMQVLKLTDDQIAMLPTDQRASIMELKKQINQPHM